MLKLTTHFVMYGINLQFSATLSNEGTCAGVQLQTLTDELMFAFSFHCHGTSKQGITFRIYRIPISHGKYAVSKLSPLLKC